MFSADGTSPRETRSLFHSREGLRMLIRFCSTALLVLALTACSGNYKFSDDDYRPLGDPQALNRGNR